MLCVPSVSIAAGLLGDPLSPLPHMATNDEILFGRIAVLSKFVTQEQVDECLATQERLRHEQPEEVPHLGTILVDTGYLSEREKRAILQVQKENLQRRDSGANARRQERIFGYLVMKLDYATEEQVFECVREQARLQRFNLMFKLGEVFVSKGYLSHDQVQEVLALQDKFIVTCEGCGVKFNVVRYQAGSKVKCPECGEIALVPDVMAQMQQEKAEAAAEEAAVQTPAAESVSEHEASHAPGSNGTGESEPAVAAASENRDSPSPEAQSRSPLNRDHVSTERHASQTATEGPGAETDGIDAT